MDQSQRVLVAGTGKSGIAAAKLILNRGGEVVLYDGNTALDEKEIKARFEEGAKVNVVLGEIKRSDLLGVELCIISAAQESWLPLREQTERRPPQL